MLNCSTCHRGKPLRHFYDNPTHRAHIPMYPTDEDVEALARLVADGIVSADATASHYTQPYSQATMREALHLAHAGAPDRGPHGPTVARTVERDADALEDAPEATEDADAPRTGGRYDAWIVGGGVLAVVGFFGLKTWLESRAAARAGANATAPQAPHA